MLVGGLWLSAVSGSVYACVLCVCVLVVASHHSRNTLCAHSLQAVQPARLVTDSRIAATDRWTCPAHQRPSFSSWSHDDSNVNRGLLCPHCFQHSGWVVAIAIRAASMRVLRSRADAPLAVGVRLARPFGVYDETH